MPDTRNGVAPKHIGAAVAFSPRFQGVVSEAWRFAQKFNSRLTIFHIGAPTAENEASFRKAFTELGMPGDTPVEWRAGEPSPTIIALAREGCVDLLVAGALEREGDSASRHFLGSVSRSLMSHCPCSLLLFTEPSIESRKPTTLVVATDFSESANRAFASALRLARIDSTERLYVITVVTPFMETKAKLAPDGSAAVNRESLLAGLAQYEQKATEESIPIETRLIDATTGYAAYDFIESVEADFLVVPAKEEGTGMVLPTFMDWVVQVVPCNLWVVRQPAAPPADDAAAATQD